MPGYVKYEPIGDWLDRLSSNEQTWAIEEITENGLTGPVVTAYLTLCPHCGGTVVIALERQGDTPGYIVDGRGHGISLDRPVVHRRVDCGREFTIILGRVAKYEPVMSLPAKETAAATP